MRICIVYDCLFPFTIGGAERWYRNVAERLAAAGHEITYLTLRQWPKTSPPKIDGITVVSVGPRMALYDAGGQRRILPPIIFGIGVFWWLVWRPRRYDVVHSASFPYFSLLAAGLLRRIGGYQLVVDWHEYWSRDYWSQYIGSIGGLIGWGVQAICVRLPQTAFCFAHLTSKRLTRAGMKNEPTVLEGEYAGSTEPHSSKAAEPLVIFVGRHTIEKRPASVPPAIAAARKIIPNLKGRIFGNGPKRDAVIAAIEKLGLSNVVDAPGFVPAEDLEHSFSSALCLVAPSSREGYGLVVVEAAARGVPTILVKGEDNAAVELIEAGVNGFIADSDSAVDLGAAIVKVWKSGPTLRESTSKWFARNAQRLSLVSSLQKVTDSYRHLLE